MKYLIDFKNNATQEQIQSYLQTNGYTLLQVWDNFEEVCLVESDTRPVDADIVEFVVEDTHSLITPLTTGEVITPPSRLWCLQDPSLPQVEIRTQDQKDWWKNYTLNEPEFEKEIVTIARKGSNLSVYIMDSGIKADHAEFVDCQITNLFSVTPGNFEDNNGHGTAIASIISGKTCGITSCPLKIVKIFDAAHQTLQSELLSALDAIINDVPANSFAVVNCSWAIPRNPWIERKMLTMIDRGIFIVASAGNHGGSIEDATPSAMPEVITIGSYNSDLKPSDFSAYTGESHISYTAAGVNGGELDGWAPGENIWSATKTGNYAYASGTSMSAAIVSAVLAHKLSEIQNEDGTRFVGYENYRLIGDKGADHRLLFWLALRRDNLLDLSDPKYAQSNGSIATLWDADIDQRHTRAITERNYPIRVGEEVPGPRLFYPHETKEVQILDPLPENFWISPMGQIGGRPVESQGPAPGESYKLLQSRIKIVFLDGMESEVRIDIYVMGALTDIGELPSDHPINIALQALCNGFPSNCILSNAQFCTDFCGGSGCCNPNFFKSTSCYCL